ncbi:MAG: dehydrogenase [Calditrichaeota bacterium]|nr:dehydrogenase [Calditrichota bacterium]
MYKRSGTFLLLLAVIIFSCKDKKYSDPLTPEEAIKAFQLNEDFDIEIFAAEPFIKDPVAMAFDDEGNAFVVELPDYPYQPEPGKGKGVIKMLLDIDKDGRADSSIIFAENLQMATSILPWKGGLLVTAAPDIIFMKDTTGDYKADIKEKLFTGFFKDNMEAQITGLLYNIDNWVYAANYGREGEVTGKGNTGLRDTLSMSGADFRFRLDKDLYEQETGVAQFGQTIDEWGHRFLTENSVHINQPVIPWRYLYRHKYLPSAKASIDISDHGQIMNQVTDAPFWRAERTRRRNKTYKEQKLDRIEYADDHFTGASGGVVYNGGIFPDKYDGNFFVTDVAGNLVHRDILLYSDSSPHFIAKLAQTEKNKEFLVSTDPWFRPVGFSIGADGCLYIIDMYRQHIETPFAIPEDLKKDMDFMNGSEYGRIYRIVPKNKKIENGHSYNFKKMASLELVKLLSHTNQQNRLRAQRILVERQDKSVIPEVKRMFIESTNPSYRLHAFYLL